MLFALCWLGIVNAATYIDPVSIDHPSESHHSLHPPLDKSQVYWNFGGSTVVTSRYIRLTPDTQDKKGWLWNEYPLDAVNWEVEFKVKVFSQSPYIGGEGFGFWILPEDYDPTFSSDPDSLNGPIFGMRNDFQGFGVIFDVYDNDNKRNNPTVFVLKNLQAGITHFNHDNDFEEDMVRDAPTDKHQRDLAGSYAQGLATSNYKTYKCMAQDLRNTDEPVKILVKYLHKVLHVYVATADGRNKDANEYKFCLAVTLGDKSFADYHIAFTAQTGQLADHHDIYEITTRYLAESDKDIDDALMAHYSQESQQKSWFRSIVDYLLVILGFVLVCYTGYTIVIYHQMTNAKTNAHIICTFLNKYLVLEYSTHLFMCSLLMVSLNWTPFIFNLPLLSWRGYCFSGGQYKHSVSAITGHGVKEHGLSGISSFTRLYVTEVVYVIYLFYYCYLLF